MRTPCPNFDITPMFLNGTLFFIADDIPVARYPIWLWIYYMNDIDVHLLDFLIVVSEIPFSFSDIVPPTLSESIPTLFGVIPCLGKPKPTTTSLTPFLISFGVT